jgi:hypothetical protein
MGALSLKIGDVATFASKVAASALFKQLFNAVTRE